jgi:glutamine amidotransferase
MVEATIIDYKVGNIFSMNQALKQAGFQTRTTDDPKKIAKSEVIILPGVGNFSAASRNLKPLVECIRETVESGVPLLGSCLGMQLLFEGSEEGEGDGLGLLGGGVVRFKGVLKTPHMGWNTLRVVRDCEVLEGVEDEYMYFVHSYYPVPNNTDDTVAVTDYEGEFTSIVARGNIFGAQFHPEKSGPAGLRLLENFAGVVRR